MGTEKRLRHVALKGAQPSPKVFPPRCWSTSRRPMPKGLMNRVIRLPSCSVKPITKDRLPHPRRSIRWVIGCQCHRRGRTFACPLAGVNPSREYPVQARAGRLRRANTEWLVMLDEHVGGQCTYGSARLMDASVSIGEATRPVTDHSPCLRLSRLLPTKRPSKRFGRFGP
jgi:hypothetical protein